MSLAVLVKNSIITISAASLVNDMPNKQFTLNILRKNIQLNKIDQDLIPIYSSQLNFKLCLNTSVPKVIQINQTLIKTPSKVLNLYKTCSNIFNWVTNVRMNCNLFIQYNDLNYLNIDKKFIDFKLQTIYDCPIYYHKINPKYVVIEDTYSQIKYKLIEKINHKKTLILTDQSSKSWALTNIQIMNYKNINKLLVKNESWDMIILNIPAQFPLFKYIHKISQLKTNFGIIFVDNCDNYHQLYSIITQTTVDKPLPSNYNLHNFLLTNYFRKIEYPVHFNITYVPLKFTPIESKIYQFIPDKLAFCTNSKIFQSIPPKDHHNLCYICDDKIENMATLKCGHSICFNCVSKITKCPLCRLPIEFNQHSLKIETTENIGTKINYIKDYIQKQIHAHQTQTKNSNVAIFVKNKEIYQNVLEIGGVSIIDKFDKVDCQILFILEPEVLKLSEVKEWLYSLKNIKIIVPYIMDTLEVELVA